MNISHIHQTCIYNVSKFMTRLTLLSDQGVPMGFPPMYN